MKEKVNDSHAIFKQFIKQYILIKKKIMLAVIKTTVKTWNF